MASTLAANGAFENLGGSYKSEIGAGGYPLDGVSFISKRRPVRPPTGSIPGVDSPIPTSTAKPNQNTNVVIPYTRTSSHAVANGDVVLVERVPQSKRGAPISGFSGQIGSLLGSACKVTTIGYLNKVLSTPENRFENLLDFENGLCPENPAHIFSPDGIAIGSDDESKNEGFDVEGRFASATASTFGKPNYPAIAVAVQGPALMLNEKKLLPGGVTQTMNPKDHCGAVVYVGLFSVRSPDPMDAPAFRMEFRTFTSVDVTRRRVLLSTADVRITSAWRLGTVMDSNAVQGPGTPMIRVHVDVNPIGPLLKIDTTSRPGFVQFEEALSPNGKNLGDNHGRSKEYRDAVARIRDAIEAAGGGVSVRVSVLQPITDMGAGDYVLVGDLFYTPDTQEADAANLLSEYWHIN